MGAIELRVSLLAGFMAGALLVLAEGVAMHRKVGKYRDHLRELYRTGRFMRLLSELFGVAFAALIQPVLMSWLLLLAMDNFTPRFSQHAVQQLKQTIHDGGLPEYNPPERHDGTFGKL